ncbi:hypothetical protein FUAX_35340 [Fulvitalea axinellae]|uniref:DUF6249 domain-containing protein n=1 Tax=Fulvitalea axinellae TaxID=1182444 RepID=A0AAU9CVP1_9BACT|nr:hypothetical protein FUAX_35340 [Fulvitalea axinellae]
MAVEILVPLGLFGLIFGIVYLSITSRNRERLALIEKGVSAEIFSSNKNKHFEALKFGMVSIGIGLGLFAGKLTGGGDEYPMPYFIGALVMGGLALVLYYFIVRKVQGSQED